MFVNFKILSFMQYAETKKLEELIRQNSNQSFLKSVTQESNNHFDETNVKSICSFSFDFFVSWYKRKL